MQGNLAEKLDETYETDTPIDLERYPIHDGDSERKRALIAEVQKALDTDGCALLKDFVRPDALEAMMQEGRDRAHLAHYNQTVTNPYSGEDDPSLPEDHPQRVFMERTNGFVAGDCLEPETTIRKLYHDPALRDFIAECMGVPKLYEYEDPLAGLVVNSLKPGCQHPWHFDNNDFIVTMLSQEAEAGGLFQYYPNIRSADDENFEEVSKVLNGDLTNVKTLDLRPGDLQIFYGRNSLHRVTRIEGERQRHTVILAYAEQPGLIAGTERTKRLFGRVHEKHLEAENGGLSKDAI